MLETGIFEKYIEITPDVEAYLKRIGYTGKPEVTLECLNELLLVH